MRNGTSRAVDFNKALSRSATQEISSKKGCDVYRNVVREKSDKVTCVKVCGVEMERCSRRS